MADTKRYDVYISYSSNSSELANLAKVKLVSKGFSCFELSTQGSFFDSVVEAIRKAKMVLFIIDEKYISSTYCMMELETTFKGAKDYDRLIISLIDSEAFKSDSPNKQKVMSLLDGTKCYVYYKGYFESILDRVIYQYTESLEKEMLYEKLGEYISLEYYLKIMSTVMDLVDIIRVDLPILDVNEIGNKDSDKYIEIINLLRVVCDNIVSISCSKEDRPAVDKAQQVFGKVKELYTPEKYDKGTNLLNISFALHMLSDLAEINREAIEIRTNGDVHYTLTDQDHKSRNVLRKIYDDLMDSYDPDLYSDRENQIITSVVKLNIFNIYFGDESYPRMSESAQRNVKKEVKEEIKNSKELFEIAEYVNKSNALFEDIGEDDLTSEFLLCLKTSYERLKYYSEIVGHKKLSAECIDKIAEINQKLDRLSSNESKDGIKEDSFRALLGFKNKNIKNFDVFISYKHEDDDLASNVYKFIKNNLLNAFYDKVTLPALGKSEYHDAIMECLDKSDNFVVVLSDLDYMQSDWVSLEMKIFNKELDEGRKPDGNFIMIVTPDVFETIRSTNKKCLPIQYRGCEIMTTADYKEKLISYLKK